MLSTTHHSLPPYRCGQVLFLQMLAQILNDPFHDATAMVMLHIIVGEHIDKPGAGRNQAEDSGEWKNTVAVNKSR